MRAFQAAPLFKLASLLGSIYEIGAREPDNLVPPFHAEQAAGLLPGCESLCEEYGLGASAITVKRLIDLFAGPERPFARDAENLIE